MLEENRPGSASFPHSKYYVETFFFQLRVLLPVIGKISLIKKEKTRHGDGEKALQVW